jgi:Kef-type K+ transport system membrane component KefB
MTAAVLQGLQVSLFAFLVWAAGSTFDLIGLPALVGEIICGMLIGPEALDVVPYADAFILIGQIGLVLLVLEGGLHIELSTLKNIGPKAFCIAFAGTTLPVLLSWGILPAFDQFSTKEGLIAGTSLSSTAIGMAAKLMQDMKMLDTSMGQLIMCAAMFDDVLSLILLAMISSAAGGESSENEAGWGPTEGTMAVLLPLISSVIFIIVTTGISFLMPTAVRWVRENPAKGLNQAQWRVGLLLWVLGNTAALIAVAFYARTTFLLGAFMAGVAFASVPETLEAWDDHMPPLTAWSSRVFFATIGFEVPVKALVQADSLAFGALLTAIAMATKVCTGVFDWENKWMIGWAMVGRGELGFVMAEQAYSDALTSKLTFSVTVWALLLSTLISPVVFRYILSRQKRADAADDAGDDVAQKQEEGQIPSSVQLDALDEALEDTN